MLAFVLMSTEPRSDFFKIICIFINMEYFLSEVNVGQLFWFRGICYQKSSDHRYRGCFRCLDPDGRPVFISGDPLVKACFFQESLF